jgi:hypothetical protein
MAGQHPIRRGHNIGKVNKGQAEEEKEEGIRRRRLLLLLALQAIPPPYHVCLSQVPSQRLSRSVNDRAYMHINHKPIGMS